MKFEEFYLDGFGIFHHYQVSDLASGLTVFLGANEAGKSTLLSFLKRLLFGFPDKRSRLNLYPPLAGGRHGGRLRIATDNKRYLIERYAEDGGEVKVILPDGSTGGEAELSYLLGPVSKDIFENIFAFGLTELQDFETLNSEAIKERLYSASVGSGAISFSEVQKSLEAEAGRLFKEQGRRPEINVLFQEIKKMNSRLGEIEKDQQSFDRLHQEGEEITEKIRSSEEERNRLRIASSHTADLIKMWDDGRKMQEAREQLQKIPPLEKFPEKGLENLEKNKEDIAKSNESITEKKVALEDIRIQKARIKVDEYLLDNKNKIAELQKEAGRYAAAGEDLPRLREKLKRDNEELKESLREIGPDWDEDKLCRFALSIPAKEIIRKQGSEIREIRENIRDAEKEVQRINRILKETEEQIQKIDEDIEKEPLLPLDAEKLKQQKDSLRLLRIKGPDLKGKQYDLNYLEERLTAMKLSRAKSLSGKPLGPVFIFIAAGIAAFILAVLRNDWALGIGFLLILSVPALIYFILSRKKGRAALREEAEDLDKRLKALGGERESLESELEKMKREMLAQAQVCGFPDIPVPQLIEDKETELEGVSKNLLKLDEWRKQKETLEQKSEKLVEERRGIEKELAVLSEKEEKLQRQWKDWLAKKGLDVQLTPEGALEVGATIKTSREKKKSIEEIKTRIEAIEEFREKYAAQVFSLLKEGDRKKEKVNVLVELEKITKEFEQARGDSLIWKQLGRDEENLRREFRYLQEKLEKQEGIVSRLLAQGFAESETEFIEKAKDWEKSNELRVKIIQGEQNIKRISGDGKLYADFVRELAEATLEGLREKERQQKDGLEKRENNLSQLRERRGGILKEIEQMERHQEGSSLRLEKAVKIQKLKKKSEEWSALVLARAIMKKAMERYEKEWQGVIKEAQAFFSKITQGRYARIYAPLGELKIYIQDRYGRMKDIQDLSRGTAEQLYLSLRFGFICEFNRRGESLPIVFDDILVNFDPQRFQVTCQAVKELTKTNQIFYFTCHPESAHLINEIIPDAKIMEINTALLQFDTVNCQ